MRDRVCEFARKCGFSGAQLDDVRICVSEAVTNATVHGFHDGRPPGTVTVSARISADELLVYVSDDGIGFAARPDSPGAGFGLPMIAAMASSMTLDRLVSGGTQLRMAFPLTAA